jgi:hypothetical protein
VDVKPPTTILPILILAELLNAPLSTPNSNVLDFWRGNVYNYPILSAMAKDCVSAERAFYLGFSNA